MDKGKGKDKGGTNRPASQNENNNQDSENQGNVNRLTAGQACQRDNAGRFAPPRVYQSDDRHGGLTIPGPFDNRFASSLGTNSTGSTNPFLAQSEDSEKSEKSKREEKASPNPLGTHAPPSGSNMFGQGGFGGGGHDELPNYATASAAGTATVNPQIAPFSYQNISSLPIPIAKPLINTTRRPRSRPLAPPITIGDQPSENCHYHRMGYTKCNHESGTLIECEEVKHIHCVYHQNLKLKGRCEECNDKSGLGNSMRRAGQWVTRTARSASRLVGRNRASVQGAFDNEGGQSGSGSAPAAGDGGGNGDQGGGGGGLGQGQPTEHSTRRPRDQRRSSNRGPTGSSVGAGGFDPTCQEDTESDKS